jgi:hypothetical protein
MWSVVAEKIENYCDTVTGAKLLHVLSFLGKRWPAGPVVQ